MTDLESQTVKFRKSFSQVKHEVQKVIVGNEEIIDGVITALIAGGHVLLEGVPGLGKTLLVRSLSQAVHLTFSRIQFTPDLMPSDITGTNILAEDSSGRREFRFQPGPIFAGMVLADEINRATPKTQSAMLEAMQENAVTSAGIKHKLPDPFFVLATQNPIEQEGTYPLPEAQLDRFLFKLIVPSPSYEEMSIILDRTTGIEVQTIEAVIDGEEIMQLRHLAREVPMAPNVKDYAIKVALATHPNNEGATSKVKQYVRFGTSPRGAQAMIASAKIKALVDGRYNVSIDDLNSVAFSALRHRIVLNFEGQADGISTDEIIDDVLKLTGKTTQVKLGV